MKKLHTTLATGWVERVNQHRLSLSSYHISAHRTGDNGAGTGADVAITSRRSQEIVGSWKRRANLAAKRLIDIALSSVALTVLSPALLLLMIIIRIESHGSPIFTQMRWGRNMSTFRVYKFRTMYVDKCDPVGVDQTAVGDCRVTRTGAILRRINIDELPQLINVLKGDMSLVGPRCHPIGMLAGGMAYEELVRSYHLRHEMRPGITGLAQVNGYRGPTTDPILAIGRIQYDLEYIRNFSVWMDLKIIFITLQKEIRFGGTGF
ncbi:sugar transferase [Mesorhizobium sp. WSM2239]|uniref:Sugar transferase n=2 Tax=unclassified Mesorhizobium TaxID=325217 RepID=A0AAU8DHQ4_9HYPH